MPGFLFKLPQDADQDAGAKSHEIRQKESRCIKMPGFEEMPL
jgi:hypothetical protein